MMKSIFLTLTFLSSLTFSFAQPGAAFNITDQAKLKNLPLQWQHFWNTHNMDSMGTMLDQHVDFVNVAGIWLKGKEETILDHKQKHQSIVFKNSTWTTDSLDIKYIKPDLALVHLSWGLSGDNDPDGTPRKPRHGIFTWLVSKEKNVWKILAAQNTNKREAAIATK